MLSIKTGVKRLDLLFSDLIRDSNGICSFRTDSAIFEHLGTLYRTSNHRGVCPGRLTVSSSRKILGLGICRRRCST